MMDRETAPARRARGRPPTRTEEEARKVLIAAARAAFLAEGYARTGIEAVARRSGMSTRTIYKVVDNKAALFRLVIGDAIDTGIAHLNEVPDAADAEQALYALVRSYARLVLGPDGVSTARAVMAEQAQFPELRESYIGSVEQVAKAFDSRLEALCREMSPPLASVAKEGAALLRSMINGAQRAAILTPEHEPTAAEGADWADRCTRLFLDAHRSV